MNQDLVFVAFTKRRRKISYIEVIIVYWLCNIDSLAFDDNPLKTLWNHAMCHYWNVWQHTINDQLFA